MRSRISARFAEFRPLQPDHEFAILDSGALIQEWNPRLQYQGDSNMRELTIDEIETVSGGVTVTMMPRQNVALALLTASFYAGYSIGTAIYNAYTDLRY